MPTNTTIWGYDSNYLRCEPLDDQGRSLNYTYFVRRRCAMPRPSGTAPMRARVPFPGLRSGLLLLCQRVFGRRGAMKGAVEGKLPSAPGALHSA